MNILRNGEIRGVWKCVLLVAGKIHTKTILTLFWRLNEK